MADLDRWLQELGREGEYPDAAAERLAAEIAIGPSPADLGRRQARRVAAACVGLACLAGATLGALSGTAGRPSSTASILPAADTQSPSALLFAGDS